MLRNYFAGMEFIAELQEQNLLPHLHYRLLSFYYLRQLKEDKLNELLSCGYKQHRKSLMLDSGAYTAWRKKKEIDFDAYLDFCYHHQNDFKYFANLDTIPEDFRNPAMVEEAAESSRNQYLDMRQYFLQNKIDPNKIIPIYHQGEDPKYLYWMLEHKIPYIGLSPSNKNANKDSKQKFLASCFRIIQQSSYPVKTHAFGLSSYELLGLKKGSNRRQFPFYSADATTWGDNALKNQIIVPRRKLKFEGRRPFQAKWDFRRIEAVTIGSLAREAGDPQYYRNKFPKERVKEINEYIRDFGLHIGYTTFHERLDEMDEEWNEGEAPLDSRTQERYIEKIYGDDPPPKDMIVTQELTLMDDGEPRIGITHVTQWRLLMNAITVNKWVDTVNQLSPPEESDITAEELESRERIHSRIAEHLRIKRLSRFRRTK